MGNLLHFERWQIVHAHSAEAPVTKLPHYWEDYITGQKLTLTERNCCTLRTVLKNHRTTAVHPTA
jgi:hypothetical protein